jgi:hypothetical protein
MPAIRAETDSATEGRPDRCGRAIPVLKQRGKIGAAPLGPPALVTLHPSALLRIRERDEAHVAFEQFVDDLRKIPRVSSRARSKPYSYIRS